MMSLNGLAKSVEEIGELQEQLGKLQRIIGKKIAYYDTDNHPDNEGSLSERLENEIADVLASLEFVIDQFGLSKQRIDSRMISKLKTYYSWHENPDN